MESNQPFQPLMSGLDVVRRLRAEGRQDICVGVTGTQLRAWMIITLTFAPGNALLTDQHDFLAAGVQKVLTKPVLEKSIKEVLMAALDRRRQQQQQHTSNL